MLNGGGSSFVCSNMDVEVFHGTMSAVLIGFSYLCCVQYWIDDSSKLVACLMILSDFYTKGRV